MSESGAAPVMHSSGGGGREVWAWARRGGWLTSLLPMRTKALTSRGGLRRRNARDKVIEMGGGWAPKSRNGKRAADQIGRLNGHSRLADQLGR